MTCMDDLSRDLEQASPELASLVRDHLAEYGELLPHVLFGDITRWLVAHGPAGPVLDILEHHCAAGDESVQNVLAVSFLENLEADAKAYAAVRRALGPCLRAHLQKFEVGRDGDLAPGWNAT